MTFNSVNNFTFSQAVWNAVLPPKISCFTLMKTNCFVFFQWSVQDLSNYSDAFPAGSCNSNRLSKLNSTPNTTSALFIQFLVCICALACICLHLAWQLTANVSEYDFRSRTREHADFYSYGDCRAISWTPVHSNHSPHSMKCISQAKCGSNRKNCSCRWLFGKCSVNYVTKYFSTTIFALKHSAFNCFRLFAGSTKLHPNTLCCNAVWDMINRGDSRLYWSEQ